MLPAPANCKSRHITQQYRKGVVTKHNNFIQLELFHASYANLGNDENAMRQAFDMCVQEGRIFNTGYDTYERWRTQEQGEHHALRRGVRGPRLILTTLVQECGYCPHPRAHPRTSPDRRLSRRARVNHHKGRAPLHC